MLHVMAQTTRIAEIAGCRLFAVHPDPDDPDLVAYCMKAGFVLVEANPAVMVMPLRRVRLILDGTADV